MKIENSSSMPAEAKRDVFRVFTTVFVVTMSVNLQMPLYRAYVANAGMGIGVTSLVFFAYVAGLLPTLILLGGLSDRLGRKPVLLMAIGLSFFACLIMALKPVLTILFIARPLQGIAVGLVVGTATAYLSERVKLWRPRTWVSVGITVLTSLGFGSGALFTGTLLIFDFRLDPPSYWIFAVVSGLVGLTLFSLQSTGRRHVPLISLPIVPLTFWPEYVSIALGWAITGIVIAIVPAEMHQRGQGAYAGLALFLVNLSGIFTSIFARRLSSNTNLLCGYLFLPLGFAILYFSLAHGYLPGLFLGSITAGSACYGFTFYGGLNRVNSVADEAKARTVAGFFLIAYLGFGLPPVILGYASDSIGVLAALRYFGLGLFLICVLLALRLWRIHLNPRGNYGNES